MVKNKTENKKRKTKNKKTAIYIYGRPWIPLLWNVYS
jgi:hypothetical protein